jgi:5-formyltetrahydrofolate cyclo-ligase
VPILEPDKAFLRAKIVARRRLLSKSTLVVTAAGLRDHVVAEVHGAGAGRVCAYVPAGTEPGSQALLDVLSSSGVEVLLPVLLDDLDLDWARYDGPRSLRSAARGLREPTGPRRGPGAVATADIVIVPALAVDAAGHRLGRGGGSYDRALTRVRPGVPIVALLHDGERVDRVPVAAHDRPVTHTVTPTSGWQRVGVSPD